MKNKLRTLVNSTQLEILTGFKFDVNRVIIKKDPDHKWKRSQKVQLMDLINSGFIPPTESTDYRFDKRCRITQAIESIECKGLPRHLVERICKQKSSAKRGYIIGTLSFLNEIMTPKEKEKIETRLRSVKEYLKVHKEMP